MSDRDRKPARRVRVERNVYRRYDGAFEIGFRDSTGKQRWRVVQGGISLARVERDAILGEKGRGKVVQPNPRLRFGDAATRWLDEQVATLRPSTQSSYRNSVETHLRPRWGSRRLDRITVDDAARLVTELRDEGKSEHTIATVLGAASRVFTFARRRCTWHGENPLSLLEKSEKPKTSAVPPRRIFREHELAETLVAARDPFKLLFMVAAVTGARESELLGLTWEDLGLVDRESAVITFRYQLDRSGRRVTLKTDESRRTVEIPSQLAAALAKHRLASPWSGPSDFVFATRSGRALGQRNVLRELRRAMRAARRPSGPPTFPVLHGEGRVPRGSVPNFHSFRHTAASEAIAAGEGPEEVAWQLGHRNSNVTRAVYIHEVKTAERSARRRAKLEARYGGILVAALSPDGDEQAAHAWQGELAHLTGST
jgi:integrase